MFWTVAVTAWLIICVLLITWGVWRILWMNHIGSRREAIYTKLMERAMCGAVTMESIIAVHQQVMTDLDSLNPLHWLRHWNDTYDIPTSPKPALGANKRWVS